jgi:hypothetical protein
MQVCVTVDLMSVIHSYAPVQYEFIWQQIQSWYILVRARKYSILNL